MSSPRYLVLTIASIALLSLTTGCKHECEKNPGTVPDSIKEAGILMEGATACGFGSPVSDEVMVPLGYVKVYHSGNFKRVVLDYLMHLEGKGWERVACSGGLGVTEMNEHSMTECAKKGDKRVRIGGYDFNGAAVDIDYLRLMSKQEVIEDVAKEKAAAAGAK